MMQFLSDSTLAVRQAILIIFLIIATVAGHPLQAAPRTVSSPAVLEKQLVDFRKRLEPLTTDSLFRMGTTWLETDHVAPDSALMCFITAQRRLTDSPTRDDLKAIAKSYINSAYVFSAIYHNFTEAYINLKKAEDICTANKFDKILAHVYLNMGTTIFNDHLANSAEGPGSTSSESNSYLTKAFNLARKEKYYEVMGYSIFNLINNYPTLDDPELLRYVRLYLDTPIPASEPSKGYISELCHGLEAINSGDIDSAMRHFASMDTIRSPFFNVSQRMDDFGSFMQALTQQTAGHHSEAEAILNIIRHRAIERDDLETQLWIAGSLHLLEKERGLAAEADRYLLDYFKLKEQLSAHNDSNITIPEIDLRDRLSKYEHQLELAEVKEARQRIIIISISVIAVCIIISLVLALRYSHRRRQYIRALYEKSRQAEILPENDNFTTEDTPPITASDTPSSDDPELVRRIADIMDNDPDIFDNNFQLATLCTKVGSNTTYVSKAINAHYGQNFKTVLTERRIRRACRILDNPKENTLYTVEAICSEVGFKSRAAFSVAFKNVTGLTPTEYRKAARKYMPPADVL